MYGICLCRGNTDVDDDYLISLSTFLEYTWLRNEKDKQKLSFMIRPLQEYLLMNVWEHISTIQRSKYPGHLARYPLLEAMVSPFFFSFTDAIFVKDEEPNFEYS